MLRYYFYQNWGLIPDIEILILNVGFFGKKVPPSEYQGVWGGISDQGGVESGQVCNPTRDGRGQKKRTLYFECG